MKHDKRYAISCFCCPTDFIVALLTGPKEQWTLHPGGPHMHCGILPNGDPQPLYFPDNDPYMPG